MVRGTTPHFILTIEGADLTDQTVYVTVRQRQTEITRSGEDLTVTADTSGTAPVSTVEVLLSQEDTLALREGTAEVQVRFIDGDGVAEATETATLVVDRILLDGVIEYDPEH